MSKRNFLRQAIFPAIALASAAIQSAPAHAASMVAGPWASVESCQVYAVSWGRELAWSDPSSVGVARQWGTDLYRDCANQFSELRRTIAAVLGSANMSGGHDPTAGRGYTLTGRVLQISHESSNFVGGGVAMAKENLVISIEFSVMNRGGRVVYGGTIRKRFPVSSQTEGATTSYSVQQSGDGIYSMVQQEVAQAVVRASLFRIDPLRVIANNGRRLKLNYGSDLLPMGSAIGVDTEGGMGTALLNVIGGTSDGVLVESQTGANLASVQVGSVARFLEKDSPEANAPRYDRVPLPGD